MSDSTERATDVRIDRSYRSLRRARALTALVVLIMVGVASGQQLTRISSNSTGGPANEASTRPAISRDGRYVTFSSRASDLVGGDTNGLEDIFVYDRQSGAIHRVSIGPFGTEGNGPSDRPVLSANGRFIAFSSEANNLTTNDANGSIRDVFVHDRDPDQNGIYDEANGVTELVSIATSGTRGNAQSNRPAISADGRFIAFWTQATNLVASDTNGFEDVLVRDLNTQTTIRVNISSAGDPAIDGHSDRPTISADGRFVAFYSDASTLVDGDTPTFDPLFCSSCTGTRDVFVRDRDPDQNGVFDEGNGVTRRVSVSSAGVPSNGASSRASISADGNCIVYRSTATNLVDGDTNGADDVFLYELAAGTTERVSLGTGGLQANNHSSVPSVSASGRYVAFRSTATNLAATPGGVEQVYVYDRTTSVVALLSRNTQSQPGDANSSRPSISGDAALIVFYSDASNLLPGDTATFDPVTCLGCTGTRDVFLADLNAAATDDPDDTDGCPSDPAKTEPGLCGCGIPDADTDNDGLVDCLDGCPLDASKTQPGLCGCGAADLDDGSGNVTCADACPDDPDKTNPGECGCGTPDTDSDSDGTPDCLDDCPENSFKTDPGECGCQRLDTDFDEDGVPNCNDNCGATPNPLQLDSNGDGIGDACEPVDTPANDDPETDDGDASQDVPTDPPNTTAPRRSLCGAFGMIPMLSMCLGLTALRRRLRSR